jgi:hypothetical protein
MTQTEMFKRLGAPLANPRWSWGRVRADDQAVFLRVWQDRKIKQDGHWFMMVTHHEKYLDKETILGTRSGSCMLRRSEPALNASWSCALLKT